MESVSYIELFYSSRKQEWCAVSCVSTFFGDIPPHFKQEESPFSLLLRQALLQEAPPTVFPRYGVSRFSLPNTLPLAANEKDPSAPLGMTIREERVSHTLFLCMMHGISIPYTVISSAVEKSSLHSVLPCPFRGRLPILLCHTYDAIPMCKKDRGLRSG